MFSDIICEQLIKKKIGPKQIITCAIIASVGLLVSWFLHALGVIVDQTMGIMGILLFAAGIALTVFVIRFFLFVEYEYSFVNGELTVDRISAKSKRKHMIDIAVKSFEKMGKYDPEEVGKLKVDVVRDYSIDKYDDAVYAYFKDSNKGNTLLIFSPNEKLLNAMKTYVSASVYREAFPTVKK